jgi:hypothetical protein
MKIRQMGAELLHAEGRKDGRTDRHDEANSRFLQSCERNKKLHERVHVNGRAKLSISLQHAKFKDVSTIYTSFAK